jgi:hypothetical protein
MLTLRHCRLFFALLCLAAALPRTARAQALPTASGLGSFATVGSGISAYQADYGQRVLGASMVYADVHPTWRFGIEGEARFLRYHTSEDVTQSTYLVGPHVYINPHDVRPYVKMLVGAARMQFPFKYAQGTYFVLAPGGGVDYMVNDRLTLRVIDFEFQDWPQFTYGTLHPYGLSAGFSIRLNGVTRIPRR